MYPLKNSFGLFQNYSKPIYLIPLELRMVKDEDYKTCFYGKGAVADAKLSTVFEELKFLVPEITCNPKLDQYVIERMNSSNPISINNLKRITASIDIYWVIEKPDKSWYILSIKFFDTPNIFMNDV